MGIHSDDWLEARARNRLIYFAGNLMNKRLKEQTMLLRIQRQLVIIVELHYPC